MKKGVLILLALALFSSLASAANSYDLGDFSKEPMQIIVIEEGDEVRFDLFNATHSIIFDRVKDVGFRFTGYAYLSDKFPMTGFATESMSSHMDINRDNESDMIIALHKTVYDEQTNKTYANVIFKLEERLINSNNLINAKTVGTTDTKSGVIKEKKFSSYLPFIGIAVFVLLLIIFASKDKKKKVSEAPKQEVKAEKKIE